ncbi:hypothetical protein EYR41_005821 [Orbilia oligospora]|uniref:Fumarylacetoacetase-like C-terminal domain-containing protein n=1 Tax=Orbilia oligospora TaxID=2813651 RepID=A0A7C8PY06_ORBOL|nr:hypothetical protein TWF751_004347 [Orbilia oligospora]TGJ69809.1 hypothetical protein EYR41_005821 [Orbilia oligospora]
MFRHPLKLLVRPITSFTRPIPLSKPHHHQNYARRLSNSRTMATWKNLIRFIAEEDGQEHLGDIDRSQYPDVGLAIHDGKSVTARVVNGSVFDGIVTDKVLTVSRLLCPLPTSVVPIIRCLGLNYRDHAKETKMPIPDVPILFIKPRTALTGPHPSKIVVPKAVQDGTSDYEAELTIVISKTGKDIPEDKALEYVLGYTAGNDVSSRRSQFENSQWSYSKGFDASAPIGPVIVREGTVDPHNLGIKAIYNGQTVQDSNTKEMIFSVQHTVSFLSRGTTLEAGTVIMTGTPPGIGAMREPKIILGDGDDIRVWIDGIGTLVNKVHYEK